MIEPIVQQCAPASPTASHQGIEDAENTLLARLAERLDGTITRELTEGGSPARLVCVRGPAGGLRVVKLLVDMPGAVDGHDLESFRIKIEQIAKVRRELPELRPLYTDLESEFHGDGWAAYTMPFYEGIDIAASLRSGIPPEAEFFPRLQAILAELAQAGYLSDGEPVAPGHIADVHVDRLCRRFWLLRKYLPAGLVDADQIIINGRACRNPLTLAQTLTRDRSLTGRLDPERLYYPVHGDLNTRNILLTGARGYRILDPRGTLSHWDPAYDISKILFSLTVWDAGLRNGFDMMGPGLGNEWTVAIRGGNYPSYLMAARQLLGVLGSTPGIQELTGERPDWASRYLLSHAFHLLAEAACRLSDIRKRTSEQSSRHLSPIELATGHYLYGVLFLEDAVGQLERIGRIDHDAALGLL